MKGNDILKIKKVLNQIVRELKPDSRLLSIAATDLQKAGWALDEAIKESGIKASQVRAIPDPEPILEQEATPEEPVKTKTKAKKRGRPKKEDSIIEDDDLDMFDD